MNLFLSLHRHRVQYFQNVNVRLAWIKQRNSLVTGFLYFVDMLYIYMYKNFNSIFFYCESETGDDLGKSKSVSLQSLGENFSVFGSHSLVFLN